MFTVRDSTSMTVKLIQGVNPMVKYLNMIPGVLHTTLQPLYVLSRTVYTATITDHFFPSTGILVLTSNRFVTATWPYCSWNDAINS